MKLFCKRALSLILMLILTAGLLSGLTIGASAVTTAERQQAVVASAWAYYDKGHNVQYDGSTIVDFIPRGDGGKTRSTNQSSPEDATVQETMYTVCSDFAHQVYYETFRYQLCGAAGRCWTGRLVDLKKTDPDIVVWTHTKDDGVSNEEALKTLIEMAQPGDVYTSGGHTMVFGGDMDGDGRKDLIHSGGRHMTVPLGKGLRTDIREHKEGDPNVDNRYQIQYGKVTNGGSIQINDAEDYILKNYIKKSKQSLVRPVNIMKEDDYINPAALYRISHPRLAIDRYLNKTRFASAYTGEKITMTLRLWNSSKTASYTVPVTEKSPEGAKLVTPFNGAKVNGETQTFDVELKPGDDKTFTCEYEITAPFGSEVVFAGGSVGDIPSNSIPIQVGGKKLSDDAKAKLAKVAAGEYDKLLKDEKADNLTMANIVYDKILGLKVKIPSFSTITAKFTKPVQSTPGNKPTHVFLKKADVAAEDQTLYRMMVPNCWGGHCMWNVFGKDRCSEPLDKHLEPGDVITRSASCIDATKSEQMIYLGDGKYLAYDAEKNEYTRVEETEFFMCLTYRIFYVLRPTLAYEDVQTLAEQPAAEKAFKFADVKESDWFYTYVKDLVARGTVKGMTETAFEPNGNLTYGQALKLVAESVGEKEPAKSGSHWASGYLTLAKEKKWLENDVNLDEAITRLSFCQICAKAKNLTEQPKENPFVDTKDEGVLALVDFGVINGVTKNRFKPKDLLTRAQISTVIWKLLAQ